MDAYVRVRLIPVVEYKKNNEWITVPVAQDSIALTVDTNDWVKDGDYWYYKEILKGNFKTTLVYYICYARSLSMRFTLFSIIPMTSSRDFCPSK